MGDYVAAAHRLSPLVSEKSPSAARSLRLLGLCRVRLGAPAEAIELLERALRLAPADPWARLHYGLGLQAAGRHAEAASLFRACLTLLPDDPAPALNLAASLLDGVDIAPCSVMASRSDFAS
jgi:Flp pilus assembly protein TadD